jgi:hypothetical protein
MSRATGRNSGLTVVARDVPAGSVPAHRPRLCRDARHSQATPRPRHSGRETNHLGGKWQP